jgi:hypothetical protein
MGSPMQQTTCAAQLLSCMCLAHSALRTEVLPTFHTSSTCTALPPPGMLAGRAPTPCRHETARVVKTRPLMQQLQESPTWGP